MTDNKICSKCRKEKPLSEFSRCGDSIKSRCKTCVSSVSRQYQKTRKGLITDIYSKQRRNSKKRGYPMPNYTLDELRQWVFSQDNFDTLYGRWVLSEYDTMLRPSCDRLDDYKPYTLDNLQLITWGENKQKGNSDRVNGINNKQNMPILQFSLDGRFIKEHHSIKHAAREIGGSDGGLWHSYTGRREAAYGFIWRLKSDVIIEPVTAHRTGEKKSTQCSKCGKPHNLIDEDAGSEREIQGLCTSCYNLAQFDTPQESEKECKHENEKQMQGDGFVYTVCADCGEDLDLPQESDKNVLSKELVCKILDSQGGEKVSFWYFEGEPVAVKVTDSGCGYPDHEDNTLIELN